MKKTTFLMAFLLFTTLINAQFTTGEVNLASNISVTIETQTDEIKLILNGPDNKWFAIGFGGQAMGAVSDVFLYDGTGNFDKVGHNYIAPTDDVNQDWTIVSNTVMGSERTIIATRALSVSDSSDYTFINNTSNISVIWAVGSAMALEYHATRGFTSLSRSAIANISQSKQIQFAMYPNPVQAKLNIVLPSNLGKVQVEVYDILGKKILQNNLQAAFNTLDVSNIKAGVYLIKIIGEGNTFGAKQFVKR